MKNYQFSDNILKAEIRLPVGITGEFIWKGKSYDLMEGVNNFETYN